LHKKYNINIQYLWIIRPSLNQNKFLALIQRKNE
jgi:hypothetical protein